MKNIFNNMKKENLKEVSKEKVNSNNAWGFGGVRGERITYDNGLSLLKGTQCCRHAFNNHSISEWYFNTVRFGLRELHNSKLLKEGCSIFKIEYHFGEIEKHEMIPYYVCSDSDVNAVKYFNKQDINARVYIVDGVELVIE